MNRSGVKAGQATATTIGFALGPRINAAGRMAHAYRAAQLLISRDQVASNRLAHELNTLNRQRQQLTREMTAMAAELALSGTDDVPLVFAAHPDFPAGIVGLIASRLVDQVYRPAIVVELRNGLAVGSCRSIPEFHITDALDKCEDVLVKHGGHAAAAGFTVRTENLAELQERLTTLAEEELGGQDLAPTLTVDMELALSDVIWEVHDSISQMEPCGYANPTPLFLSANVQVANAYTVGSDRSHLKLILKEGNRTFDGIAFRMGHLLDSLEGPVDIVYHLESNEWNGQKNLQLNIQDMRLTGKE